MCIDIIAIDNVCVIFIGNVIYAQVITYIYIYI